MKQPRRLIIVRHAEADPHATTDSERSLTDAGRAAAAAAGTWLAEQQHPTPDHALVSAARRTQQTWAELATGAGWRLEPEVSALLYSAEPDTVLDLLREVPTEAGCVVVVGHNPAMAYLANMIDDGTGDDDAAAEMTTGGFPPCSLALFEYDGGWGDLDLTSARLVAFHV